MYRNHVVLIGYLARDAELRHAADHAVYTVLTLVTKASWRDKSGEWKTHAEYHRCVAWGARFAGVADLKRGSHVQIEGELRSRDFTKDGVTQKIAEIRVNTIVHLRKAWSQIDAAIDDVQLDDAQL
jgi:single-strand DNA-binding protein